MIRLVCVLSPLALAACGTHEPPPPEALDYACDTGGRHGPTGVMDWTCTGADGERRLPVRSLHEVIEGAPIEREAAAEADS